MTEIYGRTYRMKQAVASSLMLVAIALFIIIIGTQDIGLTEGVGLFLAMTGCAGIITSFLYLGMGDKFGPSEWQARFVSSAFIALIGATVLMGTHGIEWYYCVALFFAGIAILVLCQSAISNSVSKY